jgi:hypothetical protein
VTSATAPARPSAWASWWVNSGSGAVWVVPGAAVPPAVLVGAGVVPVAVAVVLLGTVVVGVLCVTAGALATVTVFVCELPQPPSATPEHAPRASSASGARRFRFITAMVFAARPMLPPAKSSLVVSSV